MTVDSHYDVVILGGGLAGLTLARQLKRTQTETRVLVAERCEHPVPEAAHKVGESTVEIGAHYFSEVLGLKEHLKTTQLPKSGLRYFFSTDGNTDIARRVEVGATVFPRVPSYQIDRGRFENMLGRENLKLGVEFLDGCKVTEVALGQDRHAVTLLHDERELTITTRWVVDASGRSSLIKRRLDLAKSVGHDVNAAWFRIGDNILLDDWSDDPVWRAKVPHGFRRLSTNHLMGRGYWVWFIPLASDSTSVGIVADAKLHPFDTINRFDRSLAWLWRYEPQAAQVVEAHRDQLQDFRVLKHYAYSCKRVFSAERWCLTGEAGVFLDPFYSPGSDFIALGNGFITDLIMRELGGERIVERAEIYNRIYLAIFERFLSIFEQQYRLMGNAQVMTAKVVWDFAIYWAVTALLYFHNKFCDLDFMSAIDRDLSRFNQLNARMQAFFREWDEQNNEGWSDGFVDLLKIDFLQALQSGLTAGLDDAWLRATITKNVDLLEALAAAMFRKAAELLYVFVNDEEINPYAISLKAEGWQADGLFLKSSRADRARDLLVGLDRIWFDKLCL